MIKEEFVSFEIAKMLKEKGFNERTPASYNKNGESQEGFGRWNTTPIYYSAPTLQMAMKWLREVHGLHISLEPYYDYDSMHVVFLAFVQNIVDVHKFFDGRKNVASHPNAEKSYELAIKYCLENLI